MPAHVQVMEEGARANDVIAPSGFHRFFQPKYICFILMTINLLNYCDRGIVPGSTNEFNEFIARTLDTGKPDVYLGLLQSAFIVGFCISSIACGHLVHYYPPFFLCGVGLCIWCVAVLFSGLAFYMDSYTALLCARMLSGCGEASFQCSVPPWIQSNSEEGSQAMWLSLFYTAIPVGTALGYVYSAFISDSIGVKWAFIFECFMMLPFVVYVFKVSPQYPTLTTRKEPSLFEGESTENLINKRAGGGAYDRDDIDSVNRGRGKSDAGLTMTGSDETPKPHPSMFQELAAVFSRPLYVIVALGYAAQTGSLIGVATFGSAFFMGLGYYDTETQASAIFGVLVSIGGIVGTLAGGYLLDRAIAMDKASIKRGRDSVDLTLDDLAAEDKEAKSRQTVLACTMIAVSNTIGALFMWSLYYTYNRFLYIVLTCCGCALIFFATPGISIAAMNSVKEENRAFAMGMMSVVLHGLGDVPSPILAGLLKDELAPNCIGVPSSSEQCRGDAEGLRMTMLVVTLWLGWTIVCFWLARFMSTRAWMRCDSDDGKALKDSVRLDEPLMHDVPISEMS